MLYLIGLIIGGFIWGYVCNYIIDSKGYNENWFWWGFFFGIIAVIVAATRPENRSMLHTPDGRRIDKYGHVIENLSPNRMQEMIDAGGWQCAKCNQLNAKYVTTCNCGISKEESEELRKKEKIFNQESKEKDKVETLKEYKSLLDMGIISSEEFEGYKQKLLFDESKN